MTDAKRIDKISKAASRLDDSELWADVAWLCVTANWQTAEIERLREKGLRLCQELQCPAMEYLAPEIQQAWSNLFNYLEAKP